MKPRKKLKVFDLRNENFVSQIKEYSSKDSFDVQNDTTDVVIKCGGPEKKEFFCHRIILANASDFLWNALATTVPGQVPVLLLPDIKAETVKHILNYIYNGEVWVPLVQYADFYEGCLILGIKGVELMTGNDESESIEEMEITPDDINVKYEPNDDFPDGNLNVIDSGYDLLEELDYTGNADEIDLGPEEIKDEFLMKVPPFQYSPDSINTMPQFTKTTKKSENVKKVTQRTLLKNGLTNDAPETNGSQSIVITKKVIPPRNHIFRKNKNDLAKYTPNMNDKFLNGAKDCIRNIYTKLGNKVTGDLEAIVNETKLITLNNKLLRAEHKCAFCQYPMGILYRYHHKKGVLWNHGSLKRHFKKIHDITNKDYEELEPKCI